MPRPTRCAMAAAKPSRFLFSSTPSNSIRILPWLMPGWRLFTTTFGEEDRSVEEAKKAFDLRERVSERERFYITDHFYTATGYIEKDKETLELAIKTYPNDSSAYSNLALIYNLFYGDYEKAIPLANEFTRLEPTASFGYEHAAGPYMALNRVEE